MYELKIGDYVYPYADSCRRGQIKKIEDGIANVEFEVGNIVSFELKNLRYSKPFDSVYLVAKKELNDRNKQRQRFHNAPNIPKGTKFYTLWINIPRGKFATLEYEHHLYMVKASDLEIEEITNAF